MSDKESKQLKTALELAMENNPVEDLEQENNEAIADAEVSEIIDEKEELVEQKTEQFVEDEGEDNPDLSSKLEQRAAEHIAEMDAMRVSFEGDAEKIIELATFKERAGQLFQERQQLVRELKEEHKEDEGYDYKGNEDYQFLKKQHDIHIELIEGLEDNGEMQESLRGLIDDVNDVRGRQEKMDVLEKAKDILDDPRYAEAKLQHSKDEEDYLVPDAIEDVVLVSEDNLRNLEENEIALRIKASEKLKNLEIDRKIDELKALIDEINAASNNKGREVKMAALAKATEIINDERYAEAKLQHSKDEEDFEVPEALEDAVLIAEAMIRNLEDMKKSGDDKPEELDDDKEPPPTPPTPEPPPTPPTPEPPPTPPTPEPPPTPPTPEFEPNPELDNAREAYFEALTKRSGVFGKDRILGVFNRTNDADFEKLKATYETLKIAEQKANLEAKKVELESAMADKGEIPKELFEEYLTLLNDEENKIDNIASSEERSKFQKFQGWWRKHSKLRLVAGVAMAGAGIAASATGIGVVAGGSLFGASFAMIRGATSGAGAYMGAEAMMDSKSKTLGQKGLIDDVSKMSAMEGLNVFKRGAKNKEIIDGIVEAANDGNNVFEKYSVDELRTELARLRALSLDKGVEISQAGRYGQSQEGLIKVLNEAYHEKLKLEMEEKLGVDHQEIVELDLSGETATQIESGQLDFADINTINDLPELKDRLEGVGKIVGSDGHEYTPEEILDIVANAGVNGFDEESMDAITRTAGLREAIGRVAENIQNDNHREEERADVSLDVLSDILERETVAAQDELVSEVDKDRMKKIARHAIATGLGLTMGMVVGGRMFDKLNPDVEVKEETTTTTWEQIKSLFDKDEARQNPWNVNDGGVPNPNELGATVEETAKAAAEVAEKTETIVEVAKGDTVWGIAKAELIKRVGADEWAELGEGKQTYMIDAIKDKIVAEPAEFGIDGDVDLLEIGDKIDIGKAFEGDGILDGIQEGADKLSPENLQNITDNNEAILDAVKGGIKITTENVDQVAAEVREHGLDFLTKDGTIHEWSMNGVPVDKVGEEFLNAVSGEKIAPEDLDSVLNNAGEQAVESVSEATEVAGGAREFSDHALQEIMNSNDPGHIEEYISDFVNEKGWPDDKIKVFLSSLRDSEGNINNDFGGILHGDPSEMAATDLDNVLEYFDNIAVKDSFAELKNVDSGHWTAVKIGDSYHFAQKVHSGAWPFRGDSYMLDMDGDLRSAGQATLDSSHMEEAFKTGSLGELNNLKDAAVEGAVNESQEIGGSPDIVNDGATEAAIDSGNVTELSFDKLGDGQLNFHESIPIEDQASLQENYQFAVDEHNAYIDQYESYKELYGNDKDFGIFSKNVEESLSDMKHTITKLDEYTSTGSGKQHINFDYLGPDGDMSAEDVAGMSMSGTLESGDVSLDGGRYFDDTLDAIKGINTFKPSLEFHVDKIVGADLNYLNEIKKVSEGAEVIARENGKLDLAEAYKGLLEKVNSQIENLEK